jgi:hypothetical protein
LALVDLSQDVPGLEVGFVPLFKLTQQGDVAWEALMSFLSRHQMVALAERFMRGTFGQPASVRPKHALDREFFQQLQLSTG